MHADGLINMEFFASEEQVNTLESVLPTLRDAARLEVLIPLAWYLRERNTERALLLADEADGLLAQASLFAGEQQAMTARLLLLRGEARWLLAQLDGAAEFARRAMAIFATLQDARGMADTHWLLSSIAIDRGDVEQCTRELEAIVRLCQPIDKVRAEVAEAARGRAALHQDVRTGMATWGSRFDVHEAGLHPASAAWFHDFHGTLAFQKNDFGHAATFWIRAHELALESGQLRRAIVAATNVGGAFDSLFDFETGLGWMQRGLDLARPTKWPASIALCLIQTADTMRLLGRFDTSQELLQESLATLSQLTGSREYAMALTYLADLALAKGDFAMALDSFSELEERGRALQQIDFRIESARGRAHALSHLDRPQEAIVAANLAFALAAEQHSSYRMIGALEVMAQIHTRHDLPPPPAMRAASPALHFMEQALELAAGIEGYTVSGDLLDAAANAYAAVGNYAQAFDTSRQANTARSKTNSQEATNRAIALQVKYKTERAQAEGEHHRQLAASEARRAEVLQQTSVTLERLGAIGQEITAHLNAGAIFETLDRHVHALLDATFFAIYLADADGNSLELAFGIEDGKLLPTRSAPIDDPMANSVRCMRERREIVVELRPEECDPFLIPGTRLTPSKLFAPLMVSDRLLGVMSIQSVERHAYSDRERLIFRTLCAYGAIALDNAEAYRRLEATLKMLRETQGQLVDKNLELEEAYKALEEVSLTDPLTGLHNRRFLLQHVESDIALTLRRYEDALAGEAHAPPADTDVVFFVLDFDQFKAVNDLYGHASGDMVLVQMAARLRHLFRESDYLIRWGGEEFLIVARATNRIDAEAVAERVRAAVADEPFELADGTSLSKTCSIGFASYPFFPNQPRLLSWSQVLELADQSLYMAKNGGRNQWIGLYGMSCSQPDGVFQRLMRQTIKAVQDGEVRLVSSPH